MYHRQLQTLGHTCTHTDTRTHTKDLDIQHRKDMDVLKNRTEPAKSPNLRNAKSLVSGDETTAQE